MDAVARKLAAYIEAHARAARAARAGTASRHAKAGLRRYGPFFRDPARLRRLAAAGVGYYELAAGRPDAPPTGRFACEPRRRDVPRFAAVHADDAAFAALWGNFSCAPLTEDDAAWLKADVAEARTRSAGQFVLDVDGSAAKPKRTFDAKVTCRRAADGGFDEVSFSADMEAACRAAGVTKGACDQAEGVLAARCADALRLDAARAVDVAEAVAFHDENYVTLTVDSRPVVVTLRPDSDVAAVAADVCAEHRLDGDQCAALAAALAPQKPLDPWLPPGDRSREDWLGT